MYKLLPINGRRSTIFLLLIWLAVSAVLIITVGHRETYSGQYINSGPHPDPSTIGPPLIERTVVGGSVSEQMCAVMGLSAGEVTYSGAPAT